VSSASPRQVVEAAPPGLLDGVNYPFFQAVFDRKSRRMALGMEPHAHRLAGWQETGVASGIPLHYGDPASRSDVV